MSKPVVQPLQPAPIAPPLVIGVGNRWRGDDGVGPAVAQLLAAREAVALGAVRVREADGGGLELVGIWGGASTVFLVDAVCSGQPGGTIHRFELGIDPLPATMFRHSTHSFGLLEAVELARVLGELPSRLVIYGIEGQQFDLGADLSAEVELATHTVATRLWEEIAALPAAVLR